MRFVSHNTFTKDTTGSIANERSFYCSLYGVKYWNQLERSLHFLVNEIKFSLVFHFLRTQVSADKLKNTGFDLVLKDFYGELSSFWFQEQEHSLFF